MALKVKKKKKVIVTQKRPKKRRVVHIHMHSIFSIADAMCKPEETAKRAKQLGIDTIILTDHGTISGVIQFKKACEEEGIKFIPACEMYEAQDRTVLKQEACRTWNHAHHITMIPVNDQGWHDMQKMISDANKYVYYAPKAIPRTDFTFIEEHDLGRNIIATSGCLASVTSKLILDGKYDEAKAEAERRNKLFYRYFLEIQDNGSREQEIVNQALIQMSKETGIPLVYAKDVHYVRAEDKDAHHALVAISRKQTIYECAPYSGTNTYHFASADEVYDWADANDVPHSAIENTCWIADECNVNIEMDKDLNPEYPYCEPGYTPTTYLKKLMYDNLMKYIETSNKKGHPLNVKTYIERVEHEFRIIAGKGFPSYFLILWDILGWASYRKRWCQNPANRAWLDQEEWVEKEIPKVVKENGKTKTIIVKKKVLEKPNAKYEYYPQFFTGPGRGSAAGSLVAFLLNITRLDPLEYGLMFERFLSPYRNEMPDCTLVA